MMILRVCAVVLLLATQTKADNAKDILQATGVKGGLIVQLGCGDPSTVSGQAGELTAALRASDSFIVHGLDTDAKNVEAARKHIQSLGIYGPVSVAQWDGKRLPYIDNLVNLIVVNEGVYKGLDDEILRVLAPQGTAVFLAGKSGTINRKLTKPWPKEIDDWTHYLYSAGNNAVSHDTVVGPPRRYQWIGSPRWSRHHDHMSSINAVVSASGRLFYIVDEGPRSAILLPSKWALVARDAFNGTVLWTRPIPEWNTHLWPLKSGPNQLPRRLVAVGDRVYVTLGIDAPLSELDAATGQTLRTFAGTEYTDEVLFSDGTLFLLVAKSANKWKDYRPQHTYVWDNTQRANKDWAWDQQQRSLVAIDSKTGRVIWNREQRVAPLMLGVDGARVYVHDGEKAVALDRKDGALLWTSEPVGRKQSFPTGYGPTLVVQDGVVLLSVEQKSMTALDAATGKKMWSADKHRGGHMSPDDMLVIGGLVWSGRIAGSDDDGLFTGRDLRTGDVECEFPCDNVNYWFHHRCYRSKATDRYIITSRTGSEFVDIAAKHWDLNHWVRGACLYGLMPANGLLYAPPHPCGCYLESKLFGFNALAPEGKGNVHDVENRERLERGPACEEISNHKSQITDSDWPTYRGDTARSGSIMTAVPADLKRAWQTDIGGKLSSVTVADGKVFVASIDAHTIHVLNAVDGKTAWTYTAGGRIDSPPTIWQGRVIFGASDGWVYCLQAGDGAVAWRFRAAPEDRWMGAFEQLESVWPVSGAVLVHAGVVYCVAGRSAFLDGGMRLLRLDAATGRILSETILNEVDTQTGEPLQKFVKQLDMPTALPDILSCDGQSVYMRAQRFDLKGIRQEFAPMDPKEQTGEGVHLFSRSGFLDDTWWHRSFWMYGKGVKSGYGGWYQPGNYAPSGRLMVFDDSAVYGFERKPMSMCNASVYDYYIFAADKQTTDEGIKRVSDANNRINAASTKKNASSSDWAVRQKFSMRELSASGFKWAKGDLPLLARGMVVAGNTIFVAGPPDVVDEVKVFRSPDDPSLKANLENQIAAFEGRKGALLWAFSTADGSKVGAWQIGSVPVFDGMAAAGGRLFLATTDGKVMCLAGEGAPLISAPDVTSSNLDITVRNTSIRQPSRDADFTRLEKAHVFLSDLGYRVSADEKAVGTALKKLDTPLTGTATLKCRLQFTGLAGLKNGYIAFGAGTDEDQLVKCGLRVAMKSAAIIQGTLSRNKGVTFECTIDPDKIHELAVTVDLDSGDVRFRSGETAVTCRLDKPLKNITHVGYCVNQATVDFSPVEVSVR